ncbi:hypothetical protein AcV7_003040 [Taiwanofungus camphoratus]|nr:hypothetical protein AcV7_003040 [Antrodia cinnamomea]
MTIKKLEDHVKSLVQDKMLLMDRCEATMAASAKHAEGERNARLESEKLRKEMQDSRKKYDHLKEKYRDLKNSKGSPRTVCGPMQAVKRKSSQAALDSFALDPPSSSCLSQHLNATESREAFSLTDTGRPVLRIPKRPRLLGSPFDPSKAVSFGTVARPPVFKKYRPSPMDYLEGDHSSTVGSSGGPQRSGLPRGDIFSPEPGDSIGHHEEIDYWDGSFGRDE